MILQRQTLSWIFQKKERERKFRCVWCGRLLSYKRYDWLPHNFVSLQRMLLLALMRLNFDFTRTIATLHTHLLSVCISLWWPILTNSRRTKPDTLFAFPHAEYFRCICNNDNVDNSYMSIHTNTNRIHLHDLWLLLILSLPLTLTVLILHKTVTNWKDPIFGVRS